MQALTLAVLLLSARAQGTTWHSFPIGAGFTAEFPGAPQRADPGDVPDMKDVELRLYGGVEGSFVALKAKLKQAGVQREVWEAGNIDGAVGGEFDRLLDQREFLIDGWPAFDITVRKDNSTSVASRCVKVDSVVVQILTTFGGTRTKSVDRFLDSLTVPSTLGKGPLTTIGPVFKDYPVGDSGITARFPHAPELEVSGDEKGKAHFTRYATFYVNRDFEVGYGTLPTALDLKEHPPAEVLEAFSSNLVSAMDGSILKKERGPAGGDESLWCELDLKHGKRARVGIVLHGHTIACAVASGPKLFADSPEFSDFVHSVKFTKG